MMYDRILIRYGEATLKGKNRKTFLNKIVKNTKFKLKDFKTLKYEQTRDRLYIILNDENLDDVIKELKKVFGIHSFSLAAKCRSEIEDIKKLAFEIFESNKGNCKTFKVETKRAWKQFPIQSMDVTRQVASHILKLDDSLKVDVHNPELLLKVEIRTEGTFIMTNDIRSIGGFPVGIGGNGLLMLSGGIDSPVAGYLTMKRGIKVSAIHFASPPYTSDRSKQKVYDLAEKMTHYSDDDKFDVHVIPFTKLQKAIYDNVPPSYTMTVMRRMMYRISERLAETLKSKVLINGESIGQVASQTIESMYAINNAVTTPIIRPVVTMDKLEIMDIARKIDTYDISIRPYEDCCTIFVPDHPSTRPDLAKCIKYEEAFNWQEMIEECIENVEKITVSKGNNVVLSLNETCQVDDLF